MLFYRLPEALLIRISNLFMIKPVSEGGLGLSTQEVGFVQGTVGVLGLTLGGIIGGIAASRDGLKKVAVADGMEHHATGPVYVLSELLPVYEFPAYQRHGIHRAIRLRFGFTAYMLFLPILFARRTTDFTLCLLHGFHGPVDDVAGRCGRRIAGSRGLLPLLPYRNGLLPGDGRCHRTAENRPEFGKKITMETKHDIRKALLVADGGSTKTDWCLVVPHREPQLFRTHGLNPALLELPAIREILQTELLPRLTPHLQRP